MNKSLTRILIILMLVLFLSPTLQCQENKPIPEPLSALQTAEIISRLYKKLGPERGARLVESNVVLTIAGARGCTGFHINDPKPDEEEIWQSSNDELKGTFIKIRPIRSKDQPIVMISIENLKGYERSSRLTKLDGITPFYASLGWEGYRKWDKKLWDYMEKDKDKYSKTYTAQVISGINYGYPDKAILDFIDWLDTGRKKFIADSEIPYSKMYNCAEPNFCFYPESEDDEGIRKTVDHWGEILRDFYRSDWHSKLERDPEFKKARLEIKKKHDKFIKNKFWKK